VGPLRYRPPQPLAAAATTADCDALMPGPAGARPLPVDVSAAATLVREFGMTSAFPASDVALDAALDDDASLTEGGIGAALERYVSPLDDACAAPASGASLGPAAVTMDGTIAIVRPGTGPVTLPSSARAVVVDLRGLPAVQGVGDAVRRAMAPALKTPPPGPLQWLRAHFGPTDEIFFPFGVYATGLLLQDAAPLPATGQRDLPLVLLTSARMAPEAAEVAGTLRIARRAWLVGRGVHAAVAESDWQGVGGHGLAVRTQFLERVLARATLLSVHGIATQDDPFDPTTATLRRAFTVGSGVRRLEVRTDGRPGTDVDLFLLRDADGNGDFSFPDELVGVSGGTTADELIQFNGAVPPGRYEAWVHGFALGAPTAPVDLTAVATSATPWPDVIGADRDDDPATTAAAAAIGRSLANQTPGAVQGDVHRPFPVDEDPFGILRPGPMDRGAVRADLLIVHGLARRFFRYFGVVGDTIDDRLIETLGLADAYDGVDRRAARNILRRFGEALHDGHQFTPDLTFPGGGYLAVFAEEIGGLPVVHASRVDGVHPGDTILAIDGRATTDILAEELARTSAATRGYQYDLAIRELIRMDGPETLTLRDPDGATREVTVDPQPFAQAAGAQDDAMAARTSGPLGDDLYYLNLDTAATPTTDDARAAIADAVARGARGLVVDMRGYPGGVDHFEVAARLIDAPFLSPVFLVTTWIGPDQRGVDASQYQLGPVSGPAWDGPIVLITGPHAVSAAENFMQMLVGAHRLAAVVGRPSAGTNGNITGASLPGTFGFSYTGMQVLNPDGSTFHGVGIHPDVEVPLTAADLRDGVDRDLQAAIDAMPSP
jgi:C-terminal processing protease CtpA/Prc